MLRIPRRFVPLTVAVLLWVLATAPVGAAPVPTKVICGGPPIFNSIVVLNSLFDCPEDGLIIGQSGITIDLNGNTIDGNGINDDADPDGNSEIGIDNSGGFDDVKIVNGTISDFEIGIRIFPSAGATVDGVVAASNTHSGLSAGPIAGGAFTRLSLVGNTIGNLINGTDLLIDGVRVVGGAGVDLFLTEGKVENVFTANHAVRGILISGLNTKVRNVTSTGNGQGIRIDGSGLDARNLLVEANGGDGIAIEPSSDHTFRKIVSRGNGGDGVHVDGGSGHTFKSVTASGNGDDGIEFVVGSGHTISKARLAGNKGDGAFVVGTDHTLSGARATGNGDDGIHIFGGTGHTLTKNRGDLNGFANGVPNLDGLGFNVDGGSLLTLAATGNAAFGNDDPSQCTPGVC